MKLLRIPLPSVLALAAVLLAVLAEYLHVFRQADLAALVFFAAALVAWIAALSSTHLSIETRAAERTASETNARSVSRALVASAIGLAALTYLFASDNEFNSDNVLAWFGSVAVFSYAFWIPGKNAAQWRAWLNERAAQGRDVFSQGIRVSPRVLLLLAVLLLGVFSSYHDLDRVPAEMDSDHAETILDLNDVLNGARPIYFERNAGREPLEFYAVATFAAATNRPLDFMALKSVTAAFGVLLILATFLLSRELFEFDVALVAAALVAIGKWPLALSRLGLRYPLAPLLLAVTLYFLVRALKHRRRNDFLMTGLFLGLGAYGFDAFRIMPLLILAFLALWALIGKLERAQVSGYIVNCALTLALAAVVLMPLARYAVDHPSIFWSPTVTRLGGGDQPWTASPVVIFAENLGSAALMFNGAGDNAWPVNVPGDPALDYVTGGLFLLGVAYAFYRLVRFGEKTYGFVLIGLAAMLLPSALSLANPGEDPSLIEAGGAIPFVFILAALPVVWTARAVSGSARAAWGRAAAVGFIVLLVAVSARANFQRYFGDYDLVYRQAAWNSSEIAATIRGFAKSIGDSDHAWIIAYPNWVDARNVGIDMGQ
ncbi:MAG: glycosyltransferase family 39 protein, partial [Chloroflexota bacterium]|nr:glycosyltransferase family 39 protein [Chloroflexota bacterium]